MLFYYYCLNPNETRLLDRLPGWVLSHSKKTNSRDFDQQTVFCEAKQLQGRSQDFRRGGGGGGAERRGGGVPRSPKEANKPNKRATELKRRTCAHQGSMFRPY